MKTEQMDKLLTAIEALTLEVMKLAEKVGNHFPLISERGNPSNGGTYHEPALLTPVQSMVGGLTNPAPDAPTPGPQVIRITPNDEHGQQVVHGGRDVPKAAPKGTKTSMEILPAKLTPEAIEYAKHNFMGKNPNARIVNCKATEGALYIYYTE